MQALVQRVRRAAAYLVDEAHGPEAAGEPLGRIERGYVVLLGVRLGDTAEDADALAGRVAGLRVFPDDGGRMNLSVLDVGGKVLSIPQFTLYADTRRGRRPGFSDAAPPEVAEPLYRRFNERLVSAGVPVETGRFRAHMVVEIHNDGPVTVLLEAPVVP